LQAASGIIGIKVGELRDRINDGIVIEILGTKVIRMTNNAKE
jgi:hypothetical protein